MMFRKVKSTATALLGLVLSHLVTTVALAEEKPFLVCNRKFDPPIRIPEGDRAYIYEELRISLVKSRLTTEPFIFVTEGRRPGADTFDLGFAHLPHCSFNFESKVMIICDEFDQKGELVPYFRVVRVQNPDLTFTFKMDRLRFYEPEDLVIDYSESDCQLTFPAP
jgi:hypothetical protein